MGMLVGLDLPSAGGGTETGVRSPLWEIVWVRGETFKAESETDDLWQPKWNENQTVLVAAIDMLGRYSCLLSAGVLHALLCLEVYSFCIRGEQCTPHPPTPLPSYSQNLIIFNWRLIALQYFVGFCHISTRISLRFMYVPVLLNNPSKLPLHPIPLGCRTEHLIWAPCIIQQISTGYLFDIW